MAQISNGIAAIPHSWPSIAKIVINMGNSETIHCGGTLINNSTVLSAAQLRKNLYPYHTVKIKFLFRDRDCLVAIPSPSLSVLKRPFNA